MVFFKHHQSQWLLQDMISFLVSFCLFVFSFCMLYRTAFFLIVHHFQHAMTCSRVAFSMNCKLHEKAHPPLVCHCWPIASSMLDLTLALIFSQLPHPECWMPRLPLEALNCFWLALPAWFLMLAWFLCLCGGGVVIYVYVSLASRSRGSSALRSMCDTVVILLSVQDYHNS